jgi:hypothetical protein
MATLSASLRAIALGLVLVFGIAGGAHAQGSLPPDVSDVLKRLDQVNRTGGHTAGILSDADRALLFKHNDAINAARLNNEITNSVYQAAQSDFANLNRQFAEDAAKAAGAEFTVQKRTSEVFSPGTDSDYITVVKDKNQIAQMQDGYNKRVNEFLERNNVPTEGRTDWQRKLDTDFMADPRHVSPEEFRDIAKMNNDAYKNRFAADYERISRARDGTKIGPEHVTGYAEEMNDFARKKGTKIDDMFAKGPSYFNDPAKRAEAFQAMAQEQKYISRMESLDDYLRAQEGLPPRNRGATLAAQGANRAPSNAAMIREAHASADVSRFGAMEDLAETMGEVAKKNPAFRATAADDIAKIVEGLPPVRRQSALNRIRAAQGAGFVDDIIAASKSSGRTPPGGVLDDLARSGIGDLKPGALDDLAKGGMRSAIGKGVTALMDAVGRLGAAVDVYTAISQLNEYYDALAKARDPNTSDEEAAAAFAKAQALANALAEAGIIGAIVEASPMAAAAWGTWTLTRHGGEWILANTETGQSINRATTEYLGRHINAWDRAWDWYTGKAEEREEHVRSMCSKLVAAVREKRVTLRGDFKVLDACNAIKRGDSIADMIDTAIVSPEDVREDPPQPEVVLLPPTCNPGENGVIVANLREAAAAGSDVAQAHITRVESINAQIAVANASYESARQAYDAGDMGGTRAALGAAQASVDGLGGAPDCPDLRSRIASSYERADRLERILGEANEAVSSCSASPAQSLRQNYAGLGHPALAPLLARSDAIVQATAAYEEAKAAYAGGDLGNAESSLHRARGAAARAGGSCGDLIASIDSGLGKVDRLRDAIRSAEQALASCDPASMQTWSRKLASLSNPAADAVKARLANAGKDCKDKAVAEGNAWCERERGKGYRASAPDAGGSVYCIPDQAAADAWCNANNKGPGWIASKINAKGTFECNKSKEQQQAENNALCREKYGSGYYAGNADKGGTYYCLPTRKTANAWCNANNQGAGWVAGTIKADGSYSCALSPKARTRQAWAECRRQFGGQLADVKIYKNGTYRCVYNTASTGSRHTTHSSAAAAAAAGAIIQGIINLNRGGGGGGGGGTRCHHRPGTSQQHCGSN